MDGHQKLRPEEEVDVLGAEAVFRLLEIDAVKNQIQVVAVGFDLGMVELAEGVFDRKLVEVKDVAENLRFVRRRLIQIDPDRDAASWFDPGRVHPVDLLGGPAFVFEDPDQSSTLTASAACAAASRATGTR